MFEKTKEKLAELGVKISDEAMSNISTCNDWYKGEKTAFHGRHSLGGIDYDLLRLNFAKRVCADEANLCEIIKIESEKTDLTEFVNDTLKANQFNVMYREQLEAMSATGTVGAYVYLKGASLFDDGTIKGGDIKVNYCKAENIIPMTIINGDVIECAFIGEGIQDGVAVDQTLIYRLKNGIYEMTMVSLNKKGEAIIAPPEPLGDVKPFALMRLAEVNNKDYMDGYGYPKLMDAIPYLKGLELAYNVLYGDVDKADKIMLINEMFGEKNKDNEMVLSDEQKKYFIAVSEKFPEEKSLIHEYNPSIRVDMMQPTFELLLGLLSQQYGYGNKKYTFEHGTVTTATQYILEKSAEMQSLNKQRFQSIQYIEGISKAMRWFANKYQDKSYDVNVPLNIDFDDSVITDKQAKLDSMRTDIISFEIPKIKIMYLMEKYGWSEDETKGYLNEPDVTIEPVE